MLTYLIRRLFNAVITLLVVTLVTFGIFFAVPKITGSDPALLYIGKQSDAASLEGIRTKMGLADPVLVHYGKFLNGLVAGRDYDNGQVVQHCHAPCLCYSFNTDLYYIPLLQDYRH